MNIILWVILSIQEVPYYIVQKINLTQIKNKNENQSAAFLTMHTYMWMVCVNELAHVIMSNVASTDI